MNDNFKYYGFYGRRSNTNLPNYRASRQKTSSDPKVNYKEFGVYVHTENPEIPRHLEIEYSKSGEYGQHYGNVPNLTFMPIEGLPDEDKENVQNLIDICYSLFTLHDKPSDKQKKQISWAKMHALGREYMYSGYNSELSKEIMDEIAKAASEQKDNINLDINQRKGLLIQSKRTCDKIHDIDHLNKEETHDYKEIILEKYILKKDEKQLILGFGGNNDDIKQYKKNPYAFNDPWLSRSTNLGFFVWNIMINKATIKCILDNSKTLFPMQIILSTNPNYLFYEQIDNDEINIKYIGYFIARIKLDKLDKPTIIDSECERLYDYKSDTIPKSQEQYFVIFIFKNSDKDIKYDIDRYILTDFKLQRIHWGNLTRSKRVLLIEIQQLMCSSLSLLEKGKNKIYFYLISEYKTETNLPVNKICKSQIEEIEEVKKIDNGKIKNKDCYQAWLHEDTIKKLNEQEHKIKLNDNSYKIFVAKKDLNEIYGELVIRNEEAIEKEDISFNIPHNDPTFKRLIITEKITEKIDELVKVSVKEYILLPCHFKWEKKNKKNTFVLKHGDLEFKENDIESEEFYKKKLCINSTCILNRDYIMHSINHMELFSNNIEKPENYDNILKQIKQNKLIEQEGGNNNYNKLLKLFNKIKLYKQNFINIILSNKNLYLKNKIIYNRYLGFNIMHILNNNRKKNEYSNISNYLNINVNFLTIIQHIVNDNILIISNNVNILLILDNYLNINFSNITLILVDVLLHNIEKLHLLLLKNKNKIKIYFFGNILNNNLINNIINFFPNTKFSNIILDILDNNNQVFYKILILKLCKELLTNNGSLIQYSQIPNFKDNLIYLYYLIFKCFNFNTFESYTYYLLNDNMYSLTYHKIFEYNLNDEQEYIINNILNKDISKKPNLPFDQLFNDYIYIKYLTMYYNLQNYSEKIFKLSYNILENNKIGQQYLEQSGNNIIEQKGGYQTSNIAKLDLYDSKYTCTILEKQLFLLHLNCLTKVYLYENKNLDNFYIYYNDKDYGYYQEILKNMFKQITWTDTYDKNKECIFISNNLDMYHKIKPKYALMDFKLDTDNNFFDGEILYTLYPFSNTDFKILVKGYNKIKKYSDNIFQELLDNNKFFNLCYNYDIYNINKVIPIKYLKLIPGYTDNFECILEYKILYNYFYCIHNITDHTIIMNKLFDITIDNENNIKYWINCTLNKFKNAENETDIMFKNIVKLNIEQHAKHQIHLLNDYGSEVLDKQKISKAIKILEKYASDRVYIQIL